MEPPSLYFVFFSFKLAVLNSHYVAGHKINKHCGRRSLWLVCVGQCRVDCKKDNLSLFKLWPWLLARAISPMAARGIQSVGLSHVAVYLFIRNKLFSQGCEHFFFFFLLFCCCFLSSQRILANTKCVQQKGLPVQARTLLSLKPKQGFQNSN